MNSSAMAMMFIAQIIVVLFTAYFFYKVLFTPSKGGLQGHGDQNWGSRVGLVLAMAGNAVGLGNFLRFPVQAIQNGGGSFIIPYFVCFLLMGIPLLYIEWASGRFGGKSYADGRDGDHSTPFIFNSMANKQAIWKYLGVFGIFTNLAIAAYYCYIESWAMSYVYHSIIGTFSGQDQGAISAFFDSYTTVGISTTGIPYESVIFYVLCLALNVWILSKGLSGGIETVAKIAMPLLIIFGILLAIKSATITAGVDGAVSNGLEGFNYLWTPDYTSIWSGKVWLAAAGQIFFTLSVGMGTIQCYASYVGANDDIALNANSAGWMNEFVEVVLGAAVVIPMTIGYFGIDGMMALVDKAGGLGLGFRVLPYLFQQWGDVLAIFAGGMWFLLLFFAGITSSLAMGTPCVGFLKDEFGFSQKSASWTFGLVTLILGLPTVLFFKQGVFDEYDHWAGTVSLVVFALAESILFAWVFGIDKGWQELTAGADVKIPDFYKFIIKYITPAFIVFIFIKSFKESIWDKLTADVSGYVLFSRLLLVAVFIGTCVLVNIAYKKRLREGRSFEKIDY
jgi:NSS family neurotransmitter:Na+ symporter